MPKTVGSGAWTDGVGGGELTTCVSWVMALTASRASFWAALRDSTSVDTCLSVCSRSDCISVYHKDQFTVGQH